MAPRKDLPPRHPHPFRIAGWILAALLFGFSPAWGFYDPKASEQDAKGETSSSKNSGLSATFKSASPSTTQKAYQMTNSGRNENSKVVEYQSANSFEVFEDSDRDGRFGEREAKLVDLDLDGRKGEREAQIGVEQVTQNQKLTVLNNMGSGDLSSFKAAGQTQRSSIYVEEKKSEETQTPETPDHRPKQASAKKRSRVLVA